jgi:hypothetical protein
MPKGWNGTKVTLKDDTTKVNGMLVMPMERLGETFGLLGWTLQTCQQTQE